MLKRVEISGFKSIKSQSLELGKINLFIGQNGSGKSNILEAIGMLSSAISGGISYTIMGAKGIRSSAPDIYRSALKGRRPTYFDLKAEFDHVKYNCNIYSKESELSNHWRFQSESLYRKDHRGRWTKIAGRSGRGVNVNKASIPKGELSTDKSLLTILEFLSVLTEQEKEDLESLAEYSIYSPFTNVLRGVSQDSSLASPLGLFGGNLPKALSDTIRSDKDKNVSKFFKLFPWFERIAVSKPSAELLDRQAKSDLVVTFNDKYMATTFNKLYSSDVSEGALYVTFILTLLLHPTAPKIFALDNVDSSLNPGLVRKLVAIISEIAEQKSKQVLMTTHNPTALDGLDLFNDDHRLYVVERNPSTGETEITRLKPTEGTTRESWEETTGGAKLSELWLNGYLGALTPPGDF